MHRPPQEQPRTPPWATMHAPWSNHTHPSRATIHAPPRTTTHNHPPQATMHAPRSNHACPPKQPHMPRPVNRMTNWCKNITLPHFCLRAVNIYKAATVLATCLSNGQKSLLRCLYIRAKVKVIVFFNLLPLKHCCIINTQIGNNATGWKRHRFRCNINAPLLLT